MSVQSALPSSNLSPKIYYIDHLKVLLTVLVVLHHTFIALGAPGAWYYTQKTTNAAALIPMTMFVAINQAFFMGFFFFLSAYFTQPSFNKKGTIKFMSDRLIRLGLPLIFYSFILSPFLSYLGYYFAEGRHINYWQYLSGFHPWIDFGVLWFVAALLIFTLIYVAYRIAIKKMPVKHRGLPTVKTIILTALAVGIASFFVRTIFPIGWVLKPLGFQLAHFSQYIILFVLGLTAYTNNWLNGLSVKTGKRFLIFVIALVVFFPVLYVIKLINDIPLDWFSGGWHWQSLLYAVWEQLLGFSMIIMLLSYGKALWNKPSVFLATLSRRAFAVYIFHPLVVISASLAVRTWEIDPALKLLVVAPAAVIGSFLLAAVMLLVPGVKKVI